MIELGCGRGDAISVICDRLTSGTITAIDRSPAMVDRPMRRNEQHVASGRATIRLGELHESEPKARTIAGRLVAALPRASVEVETAGHKPLVAVVARP